MTVYVMEIGGRAVCAFNAQNLEQAKSEGESATVADDLMTLQSDGVPLWDGVSMRFVREAMPDESAKWEASHARAFQRGNVEFADEMWLMFLVPVR